MMQPATKISHERQSGCVLIVEDDVTLRTLIATVLRRAGLKTDEANDGVEGIDHLERTDYSVVLLDLIMPNMSGHEVIAHLNKRTVGDVPVVIVMTGSAEKSFRDLDDSIVTIFLRKPLDIDSLLSVVKSVHRLTHAH